MTYVLIVYPDKFFFSFSATNKVAANVIHKCRPFLGHLNLRGCYNLSSESIKLTGTAVYAWSNFFKIIFYVISNSASLLLWKEIFLLFLPSAQCRNLQDLNLSECSGVTVRTDNCNDYNDDNCYNKNCYQRHFFIILIICHWNPDTKLSRKFYSFRERRNGSHYFPYIKIVTFFDVILDRHFLSRGVSHQVKVFLANWSYSSVFR